MFVVGLVWFLVILVHQVDDPRCPTARPIRWNFDQVKRCIDIPECSMDGKTSSYGGFILLVKSRVYNTWSVWDGSFDGA